MRLKHLLSPRRWVKAFFRVGRFILLLVLLLNVTTESLPSESAFDLALGGLTVQDRFNWWGWNAQAIVEEVVWWLRGRPLADEESHQTMVLNYVARQQDIARLEDRIRTLYAQLPGTQPEAGPEELTTELQQLEGELAALYQTQAAETSQAERILADQISAVLVKAGFGVKGQPWPPVTFRFNDMPSFLIISERDKISKYRSVYLLPDMPEGERADLERQVEARLGVSALVDNVGGIGSWPSMVMDPVSLPSMLDIIAHEWNHNYMAFFPLGLNYTANRDLTTMNETVASMFGAEVAELVLARYYPELLPPPESGAPTPTPWLPDVREIGPHEETFSQAMRRIRLQVDALMTEGQVTEAEEYMESERQKLMARGYTLRRLNQAYFAFHGSYADGPAAVDPIGGWLRTLRTHHVSLKGFIDQVAQMDSLDALLAAVDAAE